MKPNDGNNNSKSAFDEEQIHEHIIMGELFEAIYKSENNGSTKIFRIRKSGNELTYHQILDLWESDKSFAKFYSSIFKQCGFNAYVWETPPLSTNNLDQVFEFVILNTLKSTLKPDVETFREFFNRNGENFGIVSFLNLGHDAKLVVPSPLREGANYGGLAEFFSESPIDQQNALWKVIAQQIKLRLSEDNIWVSVAGGGIYWLHIRLDSRPKYYRHKAYRNKC